MIPCPILVRVFRIVPAVQSPVLEHTGIPKWAGAAKFEGDDIVPVVEGLATGTNPHGRGRAQGVQERYRGGERERWGWAKAHRWLPLQWERSPKELERMQGGKDGAG